MVGMSNAGRTRTQCVEIRCLQVTVDLRIHILAIVLSIGLRAILNGGERNGFRGGPIQHGQGYYTLASKMHRTYAHCATYVVQWLSSAPLNKTRSLCF